MALTRITNDQIEDSTITGAKLVSNTITSGLLEDDLTYSSNLTISGNLTVSGTTTTVDTTNTLIADPLFVLSRGETGTPSADSGIVIERGTSTNVAFIWDESADTFAAVNTEEDGSTAGDITIASYADLKVGGMNLESLDVDNINIDGNAITSTDTNGNITLTPNGTGEVVLSTATVSDLTSGRVLLAGTSGALEDSANLTFDGSTLDVTGAMTASGTITGGTITDGTASMSSGAITGATNITASGTITGGTLTDGTLSANAGSITGGVAATFSGTITGGTLTDGTASFNSGALTGATTGAFGSNVTIGGTLGVTGESTLASATISDLTSGRVVLAGTSGAIEDSANLTFDGSTLDVTGAASVSGNATVGGTLGVTGESTLASATVSDLTSGRVVLAGTAGAIEDSGNLTFNGTLLDVTGGVTASGTVEGSTVTDGTASMSAGAITGATNITASGTITGGTLTDGTASFNGGALSGATTGAFSGAVTVGGTLGVTGESTLASATVSDLTATRITFAGTGGSLTDSANLTWDGSNLVVTGGIDVTGDLDVDNININGNAITSTDTDGDINLTPNGTGEVVASTMSVSDLTDNRIVVAGTSGSLEDDGNLTWDGSALAVTGGVDITGDLDIDNINIDGNVISSTNTNGNIDITPNGTGSVNITGLVLDGLTADRVLVTNSSGATATDDNLTWDGSDLDVTGAVTIDNLTIDGDTISSVHSEIIIDPSTAGPGGTVTIAGNLNVTGTTTTVDSTVVTIADPLFQLGADSDDGLDRGITALYNDGASKTAFFGLDDSASEFVFIADATDSGSVLSGSLGSAAFGSMRVTDLTSTRVLLAGTSGEIEDSGNLTFDGSTLAVTGAATVSTTLGVTGAVTAGSTLDVTGLASLDGGIDVDGAFTVADTSGNVATTGTLDVGGLASLDGGINVDDAFTVADTSGNTSIGGTLGVTGESTLASATVSDLTSGRVVLAGTAGAIEDSGNLTFDGSTLTVTGDVDASGDLGGATLTVTGNGTVGGTFGATGATTLSSTLDVTGLASLDGGIDVDGAFTVANTSGNIATTGTLNAGETTVSSATVSDLTDGRIVLAGTSGAIEDSANLTFDGSTLAVTGAITASTNITATGTVEGGTLTDGTLSSTAGTITGGVAATFSGTITGGTITDGTASMSAGAITGATNITASGTITGGTLTDGTASLNAGALSGATTGAFSSNVTVGGTLGVTGESTLASATVSDLTDNRIVIAGTAGSLEDDANLTFDGTTFEVGTAFDVVAASGNTTIGGTLGVTGESTLASATVSDLTSGRVVLAGTAGAIEDSGNFTFDGTTATITGALSVDNVSIDGNAITSSDSMTIDAVAAGSIVVNEAGADVDFRIEGSGEANALFVEGSTGNVGIKTATPAAGADLHINSTSSMIVPVGTTAQRPASAVDGMTRFNSTIDQLEFYNGTEWLVAGAEFTIITADSFTGDGSTVAFTVSESTTSAGCIVSINGVVQDPGSSYSVSGTTLTFTEAPQSGDNIDARILTTTATVEGADSADKWSTARTITLGGDLSGSVSIDGSVDVTLTATIADDSHNHTIANVDGLQTALDAKAPLASPALTGTPTAPTATAGTSTTQVATTAFVSTAVSNLVDGAPGALDTLNELAAALGDDADYAATTTTALAARLSSTATVTLTGDVTGTANFSANTASISATIAANSVALGTDTTGNYVQQGATSGNGISGSVNSEGGTFTVTSNATSANTANTIVYRDGSGNFSAGTITATSTSAQYADLAENYTADADYEAGTVVSFGGDAEVTANGADMDRRVAGVVSTDPAHLMNADCAGEHVVALALQGRVPCKVTGPVAKGDIMVAAGNGMARAEADPKVGTVIGKALEAHEGGEGVIEVAVGRF